MSKFTITISATLNGKTCKNPQVEFIQGDNFIYPCEIKDNEITIEIKPGADPNACIEGFIKCEDECLNCPPQYFKKCLCNDVTLLEECQVCKDGFIVDVCTPEQIAAGKICTPDGCQCPPATPVEDPVTGQCVQCITGEKKGCKICVAGYWQDIVCGENQTCKDGVCTCLPGYVKDPYTNACVPAPECTDDSDCQNCETCNANGQCVPVVCPPDHKCVDGDCIYWPCKDKSCNNGADCGEDCGCLNGECVPCYLLECTGECQQALGCKCNAQQKCEPVNNCGQYCDGTTPCLDTNCTCYNNTCVDCSNFPCPQDCANHYNCGCNANNECEGGKGCNDTLNLKKLEACTADGCELVAEYTSDKKCGCDPIEFRTKNTKTCSLTDPRPTATLMTISTELFKNNLAYKDYLSTLTIGDDELVSGTVTTTLTFQTKNAQGIWVDETVTAPGVPDVAIIDNKVDPIVITTSNVGFAGATGIIVTNRKVKIELRATNISIPNNDCTKYGTKVIATYELDLSNPSSYCTKINDYKTEQKVFVNDTESSRRPLFIWSKSTTSTFTNNKFVNNGVYTNSGWFRKEYGVLSAGKWTDKVNSPKAQSEGEYNELWNNYNYKVKVDCGCKQNDATLQKVVFCCPKDWTDLYELSNCGQTIKVKRFDTCSVNKQLSQFESGNYLIPEESQTHYWMILNGDYEVELRPGGGNLLNDFPAYTHTEPITSVSFEQRYTGAPIVEKSCKKDYEHENQASDVTVAVQCGKITITKIGTSPRITSVSGKYADNSIFTFTPSSNNTIWVAENNSLKVNQTVKVNVYFEGGCVRMKEIDITCTPDIELIPTDIYAKADCPSGSNPNIAVKVVSGFTAAAEFEDPRTPGVWLPAQFTSPDVTRTFTAFAAGTYTFNVRETGKQPASETITILPPVSISLLATNICNGSGGAISINGAPGSIWRISGPSGFTAQNVILTGGHFSLPVTIAGTYYATFISDASGASCGLPAQVDVTEAGGVITPTIQFSTSSTCQGQPVSFKILDGGANLTYQVVGLNGGAIQDSNGQPISTITASNNGGYNGIFIPTQTSPLSQIQIVGIVNNPGCYVLQSSVSGSVTVSAGPTITEVITSCLVNVPGKFKVDVYVSGTVTGVTVNGIAAIAPGVPTNPWVVSNIDIFTTPISVFATNSVTGCSDSLQDSSELPNCSESNVCPQNQTVVIDATPQSPTCGAQNVDVFFQTSTLGYITGQEYAWYEYTSNFGPTVMISSGTITGAAPPPLTVASTATFKEYILKITTNGSCEYLSNVVPVYAGTQLEPSIFGPTTGLTTTGSFVYTTEVITGATYTWTLSNSNGANQPIGTNSNQVTISNFAQGPNTINLTVTNGVCSGTASLTVDVALGCPQTVSLYLVGAGDDVCKNIGFSINNPGSTAITSHIWYVGVTPVVTGGAAISNFDTSVIEAGSTENIKLEIVFADSCTVSDTISYTRASCICEGNTSVNFTSVFTTNSTAVGDTETKTIGVFPSGTSFDWMLGAVSTMSFKAVMKLDGVIIFDTDYVTRASTACGLTGCNGTIDYLGDDPAASVTVVGGTTPTGTTAALMTASCDTLANNLNGGGFLGFFHGTGGDAIVLGSDGEVSIEITRGSCGGGVQSYFYIACS